MAEIDNIRVTRAAYDLATLFRVAPWIFVMRDSQAPQALVQRALYESKKIIEAPANDHSVDRLSLMRGLLHNWLMAIGIDTHPNNIEMLVGLIAQTVDATVIAPITPEIEGEKA